MPFLTDGFPTLIAFPVIAPGLVLIMREREVQPPDMDGGGEIDTSTMRNIRWRTKQPKSLITLGDVTLVVQYDPILYTTAVGIINVNSTIVITFPDLTTLTFWGWLDKFTPASLKEGEFASAEVKIHCSNQNDAGVEVAPVVVAP